MYDIVDLGPAPVSARVVNSIGQLLLSRQMMCLVMFLVFWGKTCTGTCIRTLKLCARAGALI